MLKSVAVKVVLGTMVMLSIKSAALIWSWLAAPVAGTVMALDAPAAFALLALMCERTALLRVAVALVLSTLP